MEPETHTPIPESGDNCWYPIPIAAFQDRIPSREEWKTFNRKVKKYYKQQDELITSFEAIEQHMSRMPRESQFPTDLSHKGSIISALDKMVLHDNMDLTTKPLMDQQSPEVTKETDVEIRGSRFVSGKVEGGGCLRRLLSSKQLQSHLAQVTLFCNVCLLVAKAVVVGLSGSLAIISSLMDSCVDLITGGALWWAARQMKHRNVHDYPQGRTRLEPVMIIILSVIMSVTAFQIIRESVEVIIEMSHGKLPPQMGDASVALASVTVGVKVVLWIICSKFGTSATVAALSQDNRNDVFTNSAALLFSVFSGRITEAIMDATGTFHNNTTMTYDSSIPENTTMFIGSGFQQGNLWLKEFKYLDPIGAILIAIYIIRSWWKTGKEHVRALTGHAASPEFHQKVCFVALTHHPAVLAVDTVLAFHFGQNFLVEVDIVLPPHMFLVQAHNIGEALQRKLECLPEVERAFVHLDFETRHRRTHEHKIL